MNHEALMALTKALPMKLISVNGKPYLERYYVCTHDDGAQEWLHHFLSPDSEEHMHSHPWAALSYVLCGGYTEERKTRAGISFFDYIEGDKNRIDPSTIHRIVSVKPDTWTMLTVYPERASNWFFFENDGSETEVQSSALDWHKTMKIREETK